MHYIKESAWKERIISSGFHAEMAATFAQGSIHNALDLINRDLVKLKGLTVDFLRAAMARKFNSAHKILESIYDKNDNSQYILFLNKMYLSPFLTINLIVNFFYW